MNPTHWMLPFLFLAGFIFASDINSPEWRGLPSSTYQKWSFSTSDPSPIADEYDNTYGTPIVTPPIVGSWYDQVGVHYGVWFSKMISFSVPNDAGTLNETKYRVQITWSSTPVMGTADMNLYVRDSLGLVPAVQADIIDQYSISGWRYTTFEITTAPFDSTPVVYFETRNSGYAEPVDIDEVIIDTIVIPEPATLLLLASGGLLLRRKMNPCKSR